MCLGLPCELVALGPEGAGVVRTGRRLLDVSLLTLPEPVSVGDWVLVHSGYALARLTREEALDALAGRAGGTEASS